MRADTKILWFLMALSIFTLGFALGRLSIEGMSMRCQPTIHLESGDKGCYLGDNGECAEIIYPDKTYDNAVSGNTLFLSTQ